MSDHAALRRVTAAGGGHAPSGGRSEARLARAQRQGGAMAPLWKKQCGIHGRPDTEKGDA